jgi:hypothetical protein
MEDKIDEQNEQKAVDKIYEYAANMMIKEKKSAYETKQAIIKQGLPNEMASVVVDKISEAKSTKANKDMIYGALWCIGGTIVTIVTYSSASNGGGRYVVAWGAIVFGAIQFIKGLVSR